MPSLHTAYALTVGTTGVLVCRQPGREDVVDVLPGLVVYSIVATGNHFILDAVAGAGVAGFALLGSLAIARGTVPAGTRPVAFRSPRTVNA